MFEFLYSVERDSIPVDLFHIQLNDFIIKIIRNIYIPFSFCGHFCLLDISCCRFWLLEPDKDCVEGVPDEWSSPVVFDWKTSVSENLY